MLELSHKNNFNSKEEVNSALINWWIQNFHLTEGKLLIATVPEIVIGSNASLEDCGKSLDLR